MSESIETGYCNCSCGCGLEATQLYRGVPIASVNPMTHYKKWKSKFGTNEEARRRVRSLLEQFTGGGGDYHG